MIFLLQHLGTAPLQPHPLHLAALGTVLAEGLLGLAAVAAHTFAGAYLERVVPQHFAHRPLALQIRHALPHKIVVAVELGHGGFLAPVKAAGADVVEGLAEHRRAGTVQIAQLAVAGVLGVGHLLPRLAVEGQAARPAVGGEAARQADGAAIAVGLFLNQLPGARVVAPIAAFLVAFVIDAEILLQLALAVVARGADGLAVAQFLLPLQFAAVALAAAQEAALACRLGAVVHVDGRTVQLAVDHGPGQRGEEAAGDQRCATQEAGCHHDVRE